MEEEEEVSNPYNRKKAWHKPDGPKRADADGLYYEDDDDGMIGSADTEDGEVPTPEAGDFYLNASVMFLHGGSLARGRVIKRKRDREGNPIGRENANPVLGTRSYDVLFDDGEVVE